MVLWLLSDGPNFNLASVSADVLYASERMVVMFSYDALEYHNEAFKVFNDL